MRRAVNQVKDMMKQKNRRALHLAAMLLDWALIVISYFLALWVRFGLLDGKASVQMYAPGFIAAVALYSFVLVLVYYALGLYKEGRYGRRRKAGALILLVGGVGISAVTALLYMGWLIDVSRKMLLMFYAISCALVFVRYMVCRYLHSRRKPRRVAVVGNGQHAKQYIMDVQANANVAVAGYVSAVEKSGLGCCLGSYEQLEEILVREEVDELVVALEPHEIGFMPAIIAAADKEGVQFSLIPFFSDYIPQHPTIEAVGRTKLIDMRATPLYNLGGAMLKRAMDIVLSLMLLILTSPIMLFVAIGVRLSSPGPVIFRQKRMGKDKKNFLMYKFRSMRVTDTQDTGWSTQDDPRKTRFGSFIRKYSLDELPQFVNVLKGDMSLIGPRPEVPFHVAHFKEEIPRYLVRQQVRPGISGWAQVNGLRGNSSIEERVKYDIWYIENWSIWLDIKILFMTAFGGMVDKYMKENQ